MPVPNCFHNYFKATIKPHCQKYIDIPNTTISVTCPLDEGHDGPCKPDRELTLPIKLTIEKIDIEVATLLERKNKILGRKKCTV